MNSTDPESTAIETRAARFMPPWEVGELPDPPSVRWGFRQLVGPGLMMAGSAIGGGEWLLGPAVANKYGGAIMWLALLSILAQVAYNLEVTRYALYCGEPIFVGFFRSFPGPRFWTPFYLFVDYFAVWPYLSASAATPLAAAFLGYMPAMEPTTALKFLSAERTAEIFRLSAEELADMQARPKEFGLVAKPAGVDQIGQPTLAIAAYPSHVLQKIEGERLLLRWLGLGIFCLAFIPLIFGGKIYNILVRIMVFKIILVFSYLLFLGFFYVSSATWLEVLGGFLFMSKSTTGEWGFRFLPDAVPLRDIDWALLGGFAAIAGQGGMNNAQFSSYARDRGWGMGKHVGAIPSIVGGVGIALAHTGKIFHVSEDTLRKWKGWFKVVHQDQWAIWMVGSILGVAIPALVSLEYLRGKSIPDEAVPAATAQALSAATGHAFFWFMTLFCGFLVLAPNQVTTTDGLVRRWTDVLWTGNAKLAELPGSKVRFVYFTLLVAYLIWGIIILMLMGKQPLYLVKASGVVMNFILGFTAFHTLVVNTTLLPKPLRPRLLGRLGLIYCGVFFISIAMLGGYKALKDLGFIAS